MQKCSRWRAKTETSGEKERKMGEKEGERECVRKRGRESV